MDWFRSFSFLACVKVQPGPVLYRDEELRGVRLRGRRRRGRLRAGAGPGDAVTKQCASGALNM